MNLFKSNFEKLRLYYFDIESILLKNNKDPHKKILKTRQFTYAKSFTVEEAKYELNCTEKNSFSIFLLNIRSLEKYFDNLIGFLATINFKFG